MASLALFSWGRRTGAIVLLLAFACLLPLPAFANGGEADYDIFGEVNIAGNIQKKVEQRVNEAIEGSSSGKNIIDRGFLLEGVMSNQWIITRSIINGFGDINSAIGILEGPEFRKAAILRPYWTRLSPSIRLQRCSPIWRRTIRRKNSGPT